MKKKRFLPLFILIGFAAFLRIYGISSKSFWCDEFLALSLARLSPGEMAGWVLSKDAHPPLFYWIVRLISLFTWSEGGMRIVSALFGTGSVAVFWIILKRFFRKKILFLPLVLLTLSPAAILWSQTVKSYSMLTFFSLLSVYFFLSFLTDGKRIQAAGWVITTLVILYLHNYGAIVFAAQVITLVSLGRKGNIKRMIPPFLIIMISYLPYLAGPIYSQFSFARGATHTVTNPFLRLSYAFFYFVFGETLNPLCFYIVIPGLLIFTFFFIKGISGAGSCLLTRFSCFAAAVGAFLFFPVRSTIPQNVVHLHPFLLVVAASGVDRLNNCRLKHLFSALMILSVLPSVWFYYRGDSLHYHDVSKLVPYREICRTMESEGKPGEAVIFTEPRDKRFSEYFGPYSPWDWYYRKGPMPLIEMSRESLQDGAERMESISRTYKGFWLLLNYGLAGEDWNECIKNFFLRGKSVKIKEVKLLENYSFLDLLRGKGKRKYYFMEIYHVEKSKK